MAKLIIDLQNETLAPEEKELLTHPTVCGVILFRRNFYDVEQLQHLIEDIRQIRADLLITVDQEGGRVQRFRQGLTQLPAMQAFQLIPVEEERLQLIFQAGEIMATELLALGLDLSFAPVLDLGHQCLAIGDRSFAHSPQRVCTYARQFILGMAKVGMAAVGKHFPGHGGVVADSHLETPVDSRLKEQIFSQDMFPFQQLIAENYLQGIMPAHVIYSQCDNKPASGSAYWLEQILRQQLQFDGTIFSDDLGMKGASFMGNFIERCQQAEQAGCDVLLLCNEREGVIQVLDRFQPNLAPQSAVRFSKLFAQRIDPNLNWQELQNNAYYQKTSAKLTALQQQWLAYQAGRHE